MFPGAMFAYTKSVPVQIGYDEPQNCWVLSAVVDETAAFKMVLEDETTENIDEDTQAKAKSEVGILVEPIQPYSKTNLYVTNIKYAVHTVWDPTEKAPAFDVNDAGWLTTASYKLGVWKNGVELTSQTVKVNYKEPKVIYLDTPEGKVTVNNLGILPQGVEVPSGDLILVYDPDGNAHIFPKADFLKMIDEWNEWMLVGFPFDPWYYRWEDVWSKANDEGWIPQDVQLVHVSEVKISSEKEYITLTYGGIAFAGMISVYVPENLADTIIVQLFNPTPEIVSVEPDPLPKIDEGKSTVFYVKVKNTGTEGTVGISVSSASYSFSPLTATTRNMEAGETFTFKFEAFALNVEQDKTTTSTILVQGRGGTDTYELKGEIGNVEGYTPTVPEPTNTTLIIYVVDAGYQPISEIIVSITYGASTDTELTNIDGVVQFELGEYTGDVKIITQQTSQYPSKTEIIKVQRGTNEHTIMLGAEIPWLLIASVLVLVVAVAVAVYIVTSKRRRR